MESISLNTEERNQLVDITSRIQQIVNDTETEEGTCMIYSPHTTAAITINEGADPDVQRDILKALKEIIPNINFKHMEGNSDAHIKSSLIGPSEQVVIRNRKLKLGRWQKIFFCEFDGPRSRNVWVEVTKK